jgi:hypothetical protein
MNSSKELPFIEQLIYVLVNICTLGVPWLIKIIIKKAILETAPSNTQN